MRQGDSSLADRKTEEKEISLQVTGGYQCSFKPHLQWTARRQRGNFIRGINILDRGAFGGVPT